MEKIKKILRFFIKKSNISFTLLGVGFVVWMLFLDTNSWLIHRELNQEIKELNAHIEQLQKEIKKDKKAIEQLQNIDSLEKFARENYWHKKENEQIFLIEFKDRIKDP